MNNNLIEKIKKELLYLLIVFGVFVIIMKIGFYKENLFSVIKSSLGIFWIFFSGFFVMYNWHDKLEFLERILISAPFSLAVIGISSYYAGIFGIHIKYHNVILPAGLIVIGFGLVYLNSRKDLTKS